MLIISTVRFLKTIFNLFIYLGISYMQTLHTKLQLSSYCFTSSNISPTHLSWPFLTVVAYIHTYVHIWIFMCINAYLCKNLLRTFGFINMFMCLRLVSIEWIAYQEDCVWRRLSLPHAAIINCCNSSSSCGPLWDSHILAGQLVLTLNTCQKSKVTKTLMQK